MRKFSLILILLLLTACGSTKQYSLGYDYAKYLGEDASTVLKQLDAENIDYELKNDIIHLELQNFQLCTLKEEIHGLEYEVDLQFGGFEETEKATLQDCQRQIEVKLDDDTVDALQDTLDDICKKYGEPDALSPELDPKNIFQNIKELQVVFLEWDQGVYCDIRCQDSDSVIFRWSEMSEESYAIWGLA